MEDLKIVFRAVREIARGFLYNGIFAIVVGILIFIYPDLLGMLMGLLLVVTGIVCLVFAFKVHKYSRIKIEI